MPKPKKIRPKNTVLRRRMPDYREQLLGRFQQLKQLRESGRISEITYRESVRRLRTDVRELIKALKARERKP